MIGFLGLFDVWVKAAHIIFVIFWMAGLFIFPRYLVHHQEATDPSEKAKWVEREAKLRRVILTPSMILVWIFGLALAVNIGLFDHQPHMGWLHAKLLLVILMSGYHGWMVAYSRKLAQGEATLSSKQMRMINELPALFVSFIVILVVVKPF